MKSHGHWQGQAYGTLRGSPLLRNKGVAKDGCSCESKVDEDPDSAPLTPTSDDFPLHAERGKWIPISQDDRKRGVEFKGETAIAAETATTAKTVMVAS